MYHSPRLPRPPIGCLTISHTSTPSRSRSDHTLPRMMDPSLLPLGQLLRCAGTRLHPSLGHLCHLHSTNEVLYCTRPTSPLLKQRTYNPRCRLRLISFPSRTIPLTLSSSNITPLQPYTARTWLIVALSPPPPTPIWTSGPPRSWTPLSTRNRYTTSPTTATTRRAPPTRLTRTSIRLSTLSGLL